MDSNNEIGEKKEKVFYFLPKYSFYDTRAHPSLKRATLSAIR